MGLEKYTTIAACKFRGLITKERPDVSEGRDRVVYEQEVTVCRLCLRPAAQLDSAYREGRWYAEVGGCALPDAKLLDVLLGEWDVSGSGLVCRITGLILDGKDIGREGFIVRREFMDTVAHFRWQRRVGWIALYIYEISIDTIPRSPSIPRPTHMCCAMPLVNCDRRWNVRIRSESRCCKKNRRSAAGQRA